MPGPSEWFIIFFFIAIPVVFGIVTMTVAKNKGRNTSGEKVGWFLLGFFFPLIGLIITLIIGPKEPQPGPPPAASPPAQP